MTDELGLREGQHRKTVRRYNLPGNAHYLTFSCYHQLPLLNEAEHCQRLIGALQAAREGHGFSLWGYVIMPEHVHLLLYPQRKDYSISTVLHAIKRPAAFHCLAQLRVRRPDLIPRLTVTQGRRTEVRFWQAGGGYDRNIVTVEECREKLTYIHENPVRRGLVKRPVDWPWSSARFWAGVEDVPLTMDRPLPWCGTGCPALRA